MPCREQRRIPELRASGVFRYTKVHHHLDLFHRSFHLELYLGVHDGTNAPAHGCR